MKKWSARLLALALCFALVLGEGSIVSAAESVGDSSEVATEAVVEETTEDAAASEEATEEVSEEVSEEATEEVSEEVSEEATEEVSEEVSEEATEVVSEEVSEEATEEVSEEVSEETTEETKMFPGLPQTYKVGTKILSQRTELKQNISVAFGGEEGKAYVSNQILLLADDEEEARVFAAAFAGELVSYSAGVAVVELNQEDDEVKVSVKDAVMASLDAANNLPVAWPNTIYQAYEADPAMNPKETNYQWQHDVADTTYAWEEGYDGEGVTVAVLDTGIRLGHEDLNPAKVHSTALDKEEMLEEFYKEYLGEEVDFDFSADDVYVGHGTHVSGIIAAVADNGKGGAGIAPGVDLLSCNVFMGELGAATDDIIEGIVWAQENGADIINMSLGSIVYNGVYAQAIKNAYDNGVAVFCAAGNDNTATYQYPASYPGAISIAALDKGLQKSYFSCYGDRIRYAFPGVDVYSTINMYVDEYAGTEELATNGYGMKSGTSMASPVGAGVAAVVLNYAEENGMMQGLTGAAKVEKLLEVMDSAAIPVATKGLGKGSVSLSKLVGATTFEETPSAPVIVVNPAGTYEASTVNVYFEEQKNVDVYYTTDGKTPQFKNGAPVGTTQIASPYAVITGKKSVTLKAIAVNPKTGLCSKVMTAKYTLAPLPDKIVLDGYVQSAILAQGGSYTIKASVFPSYVPNNKLVYSVRALEGATGVTVSSKGVVKAAKNATPGNYRIKVASAADERIYAYFAIKIEAPKKNIVSITSETSSYVVGAWYSEPIKGIKIETKDGSVVEAKDLAWSSANNKIATMQEGPDGLFVLGIKPGKTKITGAAKDGSNKKITLNVTVDQPVSKVKLGGSQVVAKGKSITLDVDAYSLTMVAKKAKDFNWSVYPEDGGVTVKNGKVTASKNATEGYYIINAVAKDRERKSAAYTIRVTNDPVKSVKVDKKNTKVTLNRQTDTAHSVWNKEIPVDLTGGDVASLQTIVADEAIVKKAELLYCAEEGKEGYRLVVEAGDSVGTTSITLKSIDGTNKSVKVKVTVTNPISNLSISFPDGSSPDLAYTKSMKLVPVFSTENGVEKKADKTLTWESSDPSTITVDKNGKVTSKASDGFAIIYAYSETYNLSAYMVVWACDLITKAEVVVLDSDTDINEEGERIETGMVTLKVKTKQNGTRYLTAYHFESFDTSADREGITFTHAMHSYEEGKPMLTVAEYVINKPGTYNVTFSLRDGNKVKVKHKFTMK